MSVNRLTGFYSGFDTDKLVKDLIKAEQTRVDKVKGLKQISSWKQEEYRDIYKVLNEFKSKYFDVLKSDTNITSKTMFSKYSSSITANGAEITAVEATGLSSAMSFEHAISKIEQLATKDTYTGSEFGLKSINSGTLNFSEIPDTIKFSLTIDKVTKTIEFNKSDLASVDISGFTDKLNETIQNEFGADYDNLVSFNGDIITFEKTGSELTILNYSGNEDTLSFLGVSSGISNSGYGTTTISNILSVTSDDLEQMTINGKSLSDLGITTSSTLNEMMSTINNSSLNVTISYNKASDKFIINSDSEGSSYDLDLSATFQSKFKMDTGVHDSAQNAILVLDGERIIKNSNSFTFDGISYKLNSTYADTEPQIDIKLTRETDDVLNTLKDFVTDYNNIITALNSKIDEKTYRNYQPLTDEEKEALGEEQVKLWETKAKSGLLRNDPIISKFLSEMRASLYAPIDGTGKTMFDIGIKPSSNYKDNGKLEIDEDKLKDALNNDFDSVVALFTNESDKDYLDTENITERYNENGIGFRFLDILNDAVRITRNNDGVKGSLIEKAGLPGDTSTSGNYLAREIAQYDTRIDDLLDYLSDQEDRYYKKFAAMESALAEMQNQSSSLLSQLGMG